MILTRRIGFIMFLICTSVAAVAEVYQEPGEFIKGVFSGNPPSAKKLWLTGELKKKVRTILGRDLGVLRLRYWLKQGRSAWILEEIGKERPITTGIVINNGQIEQIKVLVFREVRGWEVRYPFFTDQFDGAVLDSELMLDRPIDGISGATMSVSAVTRLARLALLLHQYVSFDTE